MRCSSRAQVVVPPMGGVLGSPSTQGYSPGVMSPGPVAMSAYGRPTDAN
jgi:hypothetical protein